MSDFPLPGRPDLDLVSGLHPSTEAGVKSSSLQNDLREILTPALLAADLLLRHVDSTVVKRSEIVVSAILRAVERMG